MHKKIKIISLILCFMMAFSVISLAACSNSGEKVSVAYHLNYDGAGVRTVEIYTGTSAVDWKASREGYKLDGWYSDSACKNKYDFSQRIKKDTNLYAAWKVYEGKVAVTFDYNYPGCRSKITSVIEKYDTIDEKYVPADAERKGMIQTGWYKDAEATQKWNFDADTVNGELTLYAGWEHHDSIQRDAQGQVIYDNVQVNVWLSGNGQDSVIYQKIAARFNSEYAGRIQVNATTQILGQETYSLRSQNTPEKSRHESTYYSVNDIYAMAGLELNYGDWYEGALKDSIYKGAMTSVPMFANVPYLVYNKELLQKYNKGVLPKNYTEFSALLLKAYEGENSAGFMPLFTNTDWTFKEGAASVSFLQNSAEYYSYGNDVYVNNYAENKTNALTALTNTYNIFSPNGSLHSGNSAGKDYDILTPLNRVAEGTSMFGFVNWAGANWDVKSKLSKVGVVPLSGLFTDAETPEAMRIPVNTFGLAFYKAKDCTDTQLAAAAVFADYCSKHSYEFTQNSWSPVRKSAYDTEKMNPDFKDLIVSMGNPENFFTFDGNVNGKSVYSGVAAESYIITMLEQVNPDFDKILADLTAAIEAEING